MAVLGLDGCKGGWVVVAADQSGYLDIYLAPDIAEAERVGSARWGVEAMVVDMPIGLADTVPRRADALAREILGPRRSSVFDVPIREALWAPSQVEANAISRRANGTGVGSMSYALRDKIVEVDEYKNRAPAILREGHPEVSFAAMAGRHLKYYKKTLVGALERRTLLEQYSLAPPLDAEVTLKRAAFDDVHDAAAMAWTALRVATGDSSSVPVTPEVFSDGWPSAIYY